MHFQTTLTSSMWPVLSSVQLGKVWLVSEATSRTQNLRRVGEISGPILTRLWTKIHEIFRRHRRPFILSNALASVSRFVQKIFATKSRSRRKTEQMLKFFDPQFWGVRRPRFFYGRLLARFTVRRLAKVG